MPSTETVREVGQVVNGIVFSEVERDAQGRPVCLVSPHGVCVRLAVDAEGRHFLHVGRIVEVTLIPGKNGASASAGDASVEQRRFRLVSRIDALHNQLQAAVLELNEMDAAAGGSILASGAAEGFDAILGTIGMAHQQAEGGEEIRQAE